MLPQHKQGQSRCLAEYSLNVGQSENNMLRFFYVDKKLRSPAVPLRSPHVPLLTLFSSRVKEVESPTAPPHPPGSVEIRDLMFSRAIAQRS